ncbi:phosphonate C-P lyase system protein PhnH [Pseudogracilibacillus sp. SO30301A]|uniref:phosphonate C-P lyase system protein PhnH n=1 Tax=Pseudogracilibacillus sp. SO30301A TaxID=3098291 RepID=UPI00300DFECF
MVTDQVHYTQNVYRDVLNAMSRPGDIVCLVEADSSFAKTFNCFRATSSLLFTLLDHDVTYHLISDDSVNMSTMITAYTLARHVPVEEADFIIVLMDAQESEVEHALKTCKVGTLRDPHLSATWIVETEPLQLGKEIKLTGPGIETETLLQVQLAQTFWDIRKERLSEFPLGLDIIFTNRRNEVLCMPRTTIVEKVG